MELRAGIHGFRIVAVALLSLGALDAHAASQENGLLYGTYMFFDPEEVYVVTFDGAGNYTGTTTVNNSAPGVSVVCSTSASGTYQTNSDGSMSLTYAYYNINFGSPCASLTFSSGQVATGNLSPDGNSFLLYDAVPGQGFDAVTGIRIDQYASQNYGAGPLALAGITSGTLNTALGYSALTADTTGYNNNAIGAKTLAADSSGYDNNAVGFSAMLANTTGYNNNAQGSFALSSNTVGYGNSAMGANSLINLTDGNRNVGVGNNTGTNLVTGSYNVDIGWGVSGSGDETGVVRIGNPTYATATYIGGVYAVGSGGNAVCVTSSGQLTSGGSCASSSSRRYKEDIQPVTNAERLMRLEPVSFHYRHTDAAGNKPLEYGLIAEQVAEVYPELVVYDEAGRPDAIKYQDLTPLLLRQIQEQQSQLAAVRSEADAALLQAAAARDALTEQGALRAELAALRERLAKLERRND